jgi:hypothetical protein
MTAQLKLLQHGSPPRQLAESSKLGGSPAPNKLVPTVASADLASNCVLT